MRAFEECSLRESHVHFTGIIISQPKEDFISNMLNSKKCWVIFANTLQAYLCWVKILGCLGHCKHR